MSGRVVAGAGAVPFVVAALLGVGALPAGAVMQTLTVTGNDVRYWPDEVTRETSGSASGSFTRDFGVRQFNPLLGDLIRVQVELHGGNDRGGAGPGAIEVGLSPNGPNFQGGAGSVSGSATLALDLLLPTAQSYREVATVLAAHTGSIAGPPGANSTDQINVPLEFNGSRTFILSGDLALFEGEGSVPFRSTLSINIDVAVTDPGPDFGIGASLIPGLGTDATVTYTFDGPILPTGDYDASQLVDQGDLNQVLNNWGQSAFSLPASWVTQRPAFGIVDQEELNAVLNNWGDAAAPDLTGYGVPEPAAGAVFAALAGVFIRNRR